jgi:hypothetical protein
MICAVWQNSTGDGLQPPSIGRNEKLPREGAIADGFKTNEIAERDRIVWSEMCFMDSRMTGYYLHSNGKGENEPSPIGKSSKVLLSRFCGLMKEKSQLFSNSKWTGLR